MLNKAYPKSEHCKPYYNHNLNSQILRVDMTPMNLHQPTIGLCGSPAVGRILLQLDEFTIISWLGQSVWAMIKSTQINGCSLLVRNLNLNTSKDHLILHVLWPIIARNLPTTDASISQYHDQSSYNLLSSILRYA